ncbi:MAG: hypothetical protein F8N36_01100 [Desulfovibrio sp.]|uniref:hypothetical protein n=1 Tax=Desulfovibrio sp. TaxID=885 RepID=UPI00135D1683|nr:hypothetical protein [Desulfovibrio sp.]MTJ91455.1 hypothetical protein [Desulfovibrio sp.]
MSMLEQIKEKIVVEFKIGSNDSLEMLEQVSRGLSGAEVYKVHLKGDSNHKGYFYLKIDSNPNEYNNLKNEFPFTNAECIEKKVVGEYYVLLFELAGGSYNDFVCFYKLEENSKKNKAVRNIIQELLNKIFNKSSINGKQESPSVLFKRILKNKLNEERNLAEYLKTHFGKNPLGHACLSVCGIKLPNAYAYAVDNALWNLTQFESIICPMHGDMHGDNVFVSKYDSTCTLIDFATSRVDGYVFFDIAYFELSALLTNLEKESLFDWINDIILLSECQWDEQDFKGQSLVKAIEEEERNWVDSICRSSFSYKDCLNNARLVARVMAGLNYAGKRDVSDDMRIKSFIYASVFMKVLLDKTNHTEWKNIEPAMWHKGMTDEQMRDEAQRLAEYSSYFCNDMRYVFVCGADSTYGESVSEALARIQWSGVISFHTNDENNSLREELGKKGLLRSIILGQDENKEYIKNSKMWWIYASGTEILPETIVKCFPEWRTKYSRFLDNILEIAVTALSPDEILVIIDRNSFRKETKYLERLLEWFSQQKMGRVALLDKHNYAEKEFVKEDYPDIDVQKFALGSEELAEYCLEHFSKPVSKKKIIPHAENRLGVPLDDEDDIFISEHMTLVCDALLLEENIEESKKDSFFCGQPISWAAISEKLYVPRKAVEEYRKDIVDLADKSTQAIFRIGHAPGSGATVTCRAICWELRAHFPTLIVTKITSGTDECLRRLSSKSGKPLIILADFDFSQNDVNLLLSRLKSLRLRGIIMHPYRTYEEEKEATLSFARVVSTPDCGSRKVLGPLAGEESMTFKSWYIQKMDEKGYSPSEVQKRRQNLDDLTTKASMTRFRLPFFYGMYTFEKDFTSVNSYIDRIFERIDDDEKLKKALHYIALITYYLTEHGLHYAYLTKILNNGHTYSTPMALQRYFTERFGALIFQNNLNYRVCHPLIAKNILSKQFLGQPSALKQLCEDFIGDLRGFEGRNETSDALEALFVSMFIKREVENETQKFSQIIMDIENVNLQECVFKKLTQLMPKNAQFFQHYGRLISDSRAHDLELAKTLIDKAIELEPNNSSHYHVRGTIYFRNIKYRIAKGYITCSDLYDECSQLTKLALNDFEMAIDIIERHPSSETNTYLLSYPYSSIMEMTTYIATKMQNISRKDDFKKVFLINRTPESQWCNELIRIANKYDIETESRYEDIRGSQYYANGKTKLLQLNFSQSELLEIITTHPNDNTYKYAYLASVNMASKEDLSRLGHDQLLNIIDYCTDILLTDSFAEGILWKCFTAHLHLGTFDWGTIVGLTESLSEMERNLTANYILYVLYFCRSLSSNAPSDVENAIKYRNICKSLSKNNSKNTTSKLFYTGNALFPISMSKDKGMRVDGKVSEEIASLQSAYLTLDAIPQFNAFFVPARTELRVGQSFGEKITCIVGFSYDGLRALDVEKRGM